MPIKGIQRKRQPWVKPAAGVLAAAIAVYEAFRHEWLFMLIALLVLLACFFSKEHLVTPEGVDIQRTLFGRTSHDLWTWEEVTAIRIDRKKVMPNVILHISRDAGQLLDAGNAPLRHGAHERTFHQRVA